jgi:hypothetical protein
MQRERERDKETERLKNRQRERVSDGHRKIERVTEREKQTDRNRQIETDHVYERETETERDSTVALIHSLGVVEFVTMFGLGQSFHWCIPPPLVGLPRVMYVGSRFSLPVHLCNAIILVRRARTVLLGPTEHSAVTRRTCTYLPYVHYIAFGTLLYPRFLVLGLLVLLRRYIPCTAANPTLHSFTSLAIACFTFHTTMGRDAFYNPY